MTRYLKTFFLLATALPVSGCALLSGRCLFESRAVIVSGGAVTVGSDSLSALLSVSEQRDHEPDRNFTWQIHGPELKNHVQRIVLVEAGSVSAVRHEFPLNPATFPPLSTGFVRESEGTNLSGMFDLLASGNAVIRITTDLPDRPVVTIPLTRVQREDWSRPYCS